MKRLWHAAVRVCALLGVLVLIVSFTPFVSWYGGLLAGPWGSPPGHTLIVLTAGSQADGFPSLGTLLRCLYAVRAYRTGGYRKIVISGAQISEPMRRLLIVEGVPPDAVTVENASTSTRENALFTAALVASDPNPKVLLTSDYHMFRAVRCFRKLNLDPLVLPIPDARKRAASLAGRWPAFLDEIAETGKIFYYFLRGWI